MDKFSYFLATMLLFSIFQFFNTFIKKESLTLQNICFALVFLLLMGLLSIKSLGISNNSLLYIGMSLCYPFMGMVAILHIYKKDGK
ncbi:Uncharacterised protein [Moraxella lacunata]|uniref:Uncharacterized protein n=2 Tax=Moraxella TaxID=475 RepID=A0A1V4GNV6_MORLA|nr:hypothetical protein [Moraxella lacunata]OPH34317.1 hypothetical protein B5J94_11605 [Moraxella lacunata]STZ00847.1 Uncharacterised protein [Moraxella lacunata]STZ07850.1 Uncharacterised protein [Moraxella caprae]